MLSKRIKNLIINSDRLYVIARCFKSINDPNFRKLVKGYYEVGDCASVLFEHKGEKYPNKIIYHIAFFVPDNEKDVVKNASGIAALLRYTLYGMVFPAALGMIPVVEWGRKSVYYDPGMDLVTSNVFEYYFEPVSEVCSEEVDDCKNVVNIFRINHGLKTSSIVMEQVPNLFACYCIDRQEIERLADLYKKYIHLNDRTKEYIEEQIHGILYEGPILAAHVRGTDFNMGEKDHPIAIMPEEYLETVKRMYADGDYKKVFLATDDTNALDLFKEEFKDKLLYYRDAFRSGSHVGAHATLNDRPLHHYKLGLEALRDIYTLANCDSLVCGLSNMSYAARYISIAIGRKFKDVVVLDNGINEKGSAESKKYMKMKKYTKEWNKWNK